MLDKLSKYVTFFSILFFVGAAWFEFLFYNGFGIEIFTFISFSEIIGLFIGYIPILFLIAFASVCFIFILSIPFHNLLKRLWDIEKFNLQERRKINRKIALVTTYSLSACFILLFGPLMASSSKLVHSEGFFFMRAFAVLIFLFWGIVPYLGSKLPIRKETVYLLCFVLIFYTSIYFFVSHKLWSAKNDPYAYSIPRRIVLKDSTTLNTNDTLLYIGKTNNYIFMYTNSRDGSGYSTIIPIDQVFRIINSRPVSWLRIP